MLRKFDDWLKKLIPQPTIREWVVTIIVAVTIAWFFRSTIASPRKIPTGSMIPTLKIGDHLFVYMFTYGIKIPFTKTELIPIRDPERGEVIVFRYPEDRSKDYIKRVIGVPGDTVEIRDGTIHVNGEPYTLKPNTEDLSMLSDISDPEGFTLHLFNEAIPPDTNHFTLFRGIAIHRDYGPIEVPAGHFFVMGDNRDNSSDSRVWGFVPRENILGKAGFIWFSLRAESWNPLSWSLRFERFFTSIH